eukprot:13766841-Alexandrium_andersonii.AAC.1
MVQTQGTAALVTAEGVRSLSARVLEAVRSRLHDLEVDTPRALEAWGGMRPSDPLDPEIAPLTNDQ